MAEEQREINERGSEGGEASRAAERFAAMARFYLVRFRLYVALALLVVLVWTPLLVVPTLRNRLTGRFERLRAALAGTRNTLPVTTGVGENPKPFPLEFERPVAEKPRLAILLPQPSRVDMTQQVIRPAPPAPDRPIPSGPPPAVEPEPVPPAPQQAVTSEAPSDEPDYREDKEEQAAYNLLLESNSDVKAIVDGANPSLRLREWGAAKRGDDTYWVKLTLTTAQGSDAEFIWQVSVAAKQVTALNFNARSLAR